MVYDYYKDKIEKKQNKKYTLNYIKNTYMIT